MKSLICVLFLAIAFQGNSNVREELRTLRDTAPNFPSQDDEVPKSVQLKWKFKPEQKFRGKLAFEIKTDDDSPKRTLFLYDFRWRVQFLDEDDRVNTNRLGYSRLLLARRSPGGCQGH